MNGFQLHGDLRRIVRILYENHINFSVNYTQGTIEPENTCAALCAVLHSHDEELERLYREKWKLYDLE